MAHHVPGLVLAEMDVKLVLIRKVALRFPYTCPCP
jgi:hypothetical protein